MYLTQGLHRAVQRDPHRVAVIDGDRDSTFADLSKRVACLASGLSMRGVRPGDRVGILAAKSLPYVSGGENVYSAEVEKVLGQRPAVANRAVISGPDPDWGERVHAVIVAVPESGVTAETLRDFVGERIAPYKAPRTVAFVDAPPLSPVGKILERVLREEYVL